MALNLLAFKILQLLRDVPIKQTGVKFRCISLWCIQEWNGSPLLGSLPNAKMYYKNIFQPVTTCFFILHKHFENDMQYDVIYH